MKTNDVSQRVEGDATSPPPVSSVSVRTSPDMTPGGDHVASFDAEQVETLMIMLNYLQPLEPR